MSRNDLIKLEMAVVLTIAAVLVVMILNLLRMIPGS